MYDIIYINKQTGRIMNKIKELKKIISRASLLGKSEIEALSKIPDEYFVDIFEKNFNGNLSLARRIIMNDYDEVDRVDVARLDKEKRQIRNFQSSVNTMVDYAKSGKKILFVTDNDNDGSLSQAAILEFRKMIPDEFNDNIKVVYAQTIGGNSARGITKEVVDAHASILKLTKDSDFLIITADNGINSREEQVRIQKDYPNTKLLITDHHLPDEFEAVQETSRTIIFNPKYKPTKFFKEKNISGANTLAVLLEEFARVTYQETNNESFEDKYSENIKNIREISKIANLLDYVDTDIADKPLKPYILDKFINIGPLLNVNNSLSKIITGEITADILDTISQNIPDIDIENLKEQFKIIKLQNNQAKILLDIVDEHTLNGVSRNYGSNIEEILIGKLNDKVNTDDINQNYIEQLRPLIYNFSAIDNKDAFVDSINGLMISCFEQIRYAEKSILTELRKGSILNINKGEFSTIITPKDTAITKIFNRKLIGKAYNEENNGFILTLDNIKDTEMTGSFRAIYRIQDMIKNIGDFESKNNVNISFMGHDKAAGFFIRSKNGKKIANSEKLMDDLNLFFDGEIFKLRNNMVADELPPLLVDLGTVPIIDKINMAVRGNITNMNHIAPIIKFNKSTYLTDSRTAEQKSLQELASDKKYGYVSINANFDGDTIIIPTELLRSVVDSNFKNALKLSYINDGVMIVSNTIDSDKIKRVSDIRYGNKDEKKLTDYYTERFLKDGKHQVHLTYDNIKKLSYFKNNTFGDIEFERFENFIIDVLNKTESDVLAVFDTEGTGLGKAPKLFNLGALNVSIDEGNFEKISVTDFKNNYFTTIDGSGFLLNINDQDELIEISSDKVKKLPFSARKLIIKHNETGQTYLHNPSLVENLNSFKKVSNHKVDGENVVFNQKIKFDMISYLINDTDFKISPEIQNLTGVSNTMLNKVGRRTAEVDAEFTDKYKGKKVIFQAHNLPYDLGIIGSNMPKLYELMNNSLLSDSAVFARNFKLAYDKVEMGHIDLPLIKSHYFYSSDVSDYSFENFIRNGENGIFPDRTGNYVARIKDSNLSLIDRRENKEVLIGSLEEALASFSKREMPNNSIKYSVQELSTHENIRNMLLSKDDFKISLISIPDELEPIKRELTFFMDNYHFDSLKEENMYNFKRYLQSKEMDSSVSKLLDKKVFEDFVSNFIDKNKETQAKFHDSWIYKKVLKLHNPVGKVTNDMVDIISYKTDLPREKVEVVLNDAIEYKNKYGLKSVILDEVHNNIIYDGDGYGDVMLELALTMKRLGDRNYDSYSKTINYASEHFRANISDTMRKHKTRDMKGLELDSYSARQARAYSRSIKTDFISQTHKDQTGSLKLKLPIDILPTGSSVYIKIKDGVKLNNEKIDEISEKIGDIVRVEQLKNSALNMKINPDLINILMTSLSMNDESSLKSKADVLELCEFVYFDRRDSVMKKVSETLSDVISGGVSPKKAISYNFSLADHLDIIDLANQIIDINNKIGLDTNYEGLKNFLSLHNISANYDGDIIKSSISGNNLSISLVDEMKEARDFYQGMRGEDSVDNGIIDYSFLNGLDIKRRSIIGWSNKNAPNVFNERLNNITEYTISDYEEFKLNPEPVSKKAKIKIKQ